MRTRPIPAISTALPAVLRGVIQNAPVEEAAILLWPVVCGSKVAQQTRVLKLENGAIHIRVPDTAWRSQLQQFSSSYLGSFEKLLPGAIMNIVFTA